MKAHLKILVLQALLAPVLCVAGDVLECVLGPEGLSSLKTGGDEWLKAGRPKLNAVTFEQTTPDEQGYKKYAFEKPEVVETQAVYDAAAKCWHLTYAWGTADWTYRPSPNRLDISLKLSNTSNKTIAYFYATALEMKLPGWKKGAPKTPSSLDRLANTHIDGPGSALDICNATMDPPFYLCLIKPRNNAKKDDAKAKEQVKPADDKVDEYPLVVAGGVYTPEPGSYTIEPLGVPRIPAGKSLTLEITLRFSPPTPDPKIDCLEDLYPKFRETYGTALDWKDRRPICMLMRVMQKEKTDANPRRWFSDKNVDIKDKAAFKAFAIKDAQHCADCMKQVDAQGFVFWDPEGEENPQPITYIGDPHLVKTMAPEFDEVADDYFKVFLDAGLKTGICIRPTQLYQEEKTHKWNHGTGSDGGPGRGSHFPELRPADLPWWDFYPVAERLCDKIEYAKKRWGCTIFYIDTNGIFRKVGEDGQFKWFLLTTAVWKAVKQKHPDVLLIPELTGDDYTNHDATWCYATPYSQLNMGGYGTPASIRKLIPGAFTLLNVTDGDFKAHRDQLADAVRNGDIMMVHGWWSPDRSTEVKALYDEVVKGIQPPPKAASGKPAK